MRDVVLGAYVHLAMIAVAAGGGERSVAYDQATGQWLFDPAAIVSRNDVLYVTPSAAAWEAMPVGGGDFSAMVYCDGAGLDLHLTKSDAWGFQQPADAPLGKRFFNNVSPGHVRLEFGPRGGELAAARFRQRLDLYRGRVVVELGPEEHEVRLEVWGHPHRPLLLVEVTDPHRVLQTYDGTIRLLPAVPGTWSGIYQLRGERGFLVAVDFTAGTPQVVELRSLHGNRCRLQNPWGRMSVVRHAQEVVLRSAEPVLEFDTRADQRYLVEAADQPLDAFPVRPLDDQASQQPELPGRAY